MCTELGALGPCPSRIIRRPPGPIVVVPHREDGWDCLGQTNDPGGSWACWRDDRAIWRCSPGLVLFRMIPGSALRLAAVRRVVSMRTRSGLKGCNHAGSPTSFMSEVTDSAVDYEGQAGPRSRGRLFGQRGR
jgi:hypothetical protein